MTYQREKLKSKFYILLLINLLLSILLSAQGIIIPSGAYMIAGNGNIVVKNNWVNNGSFTHNGGTLIFNGTTQTISGTSATTFNNLTTITGSTTSISSAGHKIKNVLLSSGTLNANGNLTLLSTAAQTAAIDGSGTGQVLGNLIVQRYITSAFGYKYLSSPFQNDTVGDFANDMNLAASFPVLYRHDENLTSTGWVAYTTGSGVLSPMQGYAANLGASAAPKTIDLQGVVNNNTVSKTLSNNNRAYTKGFNLVGNPYPSPVNWSAASGWTKTNIDNAVYYFNASPTDQYAGVYSSYVNGVSSDGIAGPVIAAMQGFFVHVTNGSFPVAAQLIATNNVRVLNATASFYRVYGQNETPLLRLSAGFTDETTVADPVTFYFSEDAVGIKFNKNIDALKLLNTESTIPNLFAVSADAEKLSINALKPQYDTTIVPLGLVTQKDGWITFNAKDMQHIPAGLDIFLEDIKTGVSVDLKKDSLYRLLLPAGDYENRFFLNFCTGSLPPVVNNNPVSTGVFNAYSQSGILYVNGNLTANERGTVTVVNMAGQIICRQQISGNAYQPLKPVFTSAMYVVNLSASGKNVSKKIFVESR